MGGKAGITSMTIQDFLRDLANKPRFYIMYCPDSELRPIYIKKFVEAHNGKQVNRETMDIGKQPRQIGPKPVYVVTDWDDPHKKPSHKYLNVNYPVLLVYTKYDEPTEAVKEVFEGHIVVIPKVTGTQVTTLLKKQGVPEPIINFLKEKTSSSQESILLGKQLMALSKELNLMPQDCFELYYKKALVGRNIDEEPTEFLMSILERKYQITFEYLASQRGNELFVYASLLNWLEDMIKFCSCNGDFWNDAGLVAAKYNPFKQARVSKIPYVVLVRLYEEGLRSMQSIKINEPDPSTALEVFVCRIIQTLV